MLRIKDKQQKCKYFLLLLINNESQHGQYKDHLDGQLTIRLQVPLGTSSSPYCGSMNIRVSWIDQKSSVFKLWLNVHSVTFGLKTQPDQQQNSDCCQKSHFCLILRFVPISTDIIFFVYLNKQTSWIVVLYFVPLQATRDSFFFFHFFVFCLQQSGSASPWSTWSPQHLAAAILNLVKRQSTRWVKSRPGKYVFYACLRSLRAWHMF